MRHRQILASAPHFHKSPIFLAFYHSADRNILFKWRDKNAETRDISRSLIDCRSVRTGGPFTPSRLAGQPTVGLPWTWHRWIEQKAAHLLLIFSIIPSELGRRQSADKRLKVCTPHRSTGTSWQRCSCSTRPVMNVPTAPSVRRGGRACFMLFSVRYAN